MKAIVAGAGIGGLAAALALRQTGCAVEIFEKAISLDPIGAGVQISPNAVHVLDSLGLAEEIRRLASAPQAVNILSWRGRALARIPLGRVAMERYGAPYLVIHRAGLQSLLLEAARDIPIRFGAGAADFAMDDDGVVLALDDGATAAADVLIGADGLRSAVRERLIGDGPPRATGYIAWRSLAPASSSFAMDETDVWFGPGAHLVRYAVERGTRLNIVAVTKDGRPPSEAFRSWSSAARGLIATAEDWRPWPLFERRNPPPHGDGRATLLGDALHPILPFLAQGAALAIEDASTLALALKEGRNDPSAALRRYEAARCKRRMRIADASRKQGRIDHLRGPFAWARDLVLRSAPPPLLLARQDWIYGWR